MRKEAFGNATVRVLFVALSLGLGPLTVVS